MIEDELRALPLFAGVGAEGLAAAAAGGVAEVEAGQVLAQAGDRGSGMYVVLEGELVVDLHGLQAAIGPGDFFGELSLIVPEADRVARVRATTAARLLPVSRSTFETLLETEPGFARALLRELAERLIAARTGR